MHFACCSTVFSEDIKNVSEDAPPPWKFANGAAFNFRSGLNEVRTQLAETCQTAKEKENLVPTEEEEDTDILMEIWTQVITDLSERNLSYETDILFAAAGTISLLELIFNVNGIYGLPERRLEEFLFWSPVEPGQLGRRRDLEKKPFNPSWSWAGWVGEIHFAEHTARPLEPYFDSIQWMGLEKLGAEPSPLQNHGRGTSRDDAVEALAGAKNRVADLDLPLLQFRTRTIRLCISRSASPPEWIEELQVYPWAYVPSEGKDKEGVFCVTALEDDSDIVGSVVLDSVQEMLDTQRLPTTFAMVSATPYEEEQNESSHGLVFYRVLALRFNGDIAERIGHGAILRVIMEDQRSKEETVILG